MAEALMGTYLRAAPVLARGEGAWLEDVEGRRWLDLLSGIGVNALGHGHPALVRALTEQATTLGHVSNLYRHAPGEELAARLCARTGFDAVFFSNSGSEANEAALKIARKHQRAAGRPERTSFVALEGGFHGRTLGSLSVTSNAAYREPFGPLLDVAFVPPDDVEALSGALARGPAALVLEPIQGEGGVRPLDAEYLRAARRLCDETETVLVHDEVQSGCARSGTFLAGDAAGVRPDVVTLAKPLGAGLPIGATLARGPFAEALVPGDHGSTFGGGPFAARAGLALLDELDAGLEDAARERGARLESGLDALAARHEGVATGRRGRGLMQGLVLPGRAKEAAARAFDAGMLVGTATPDVLRLLPPFVLGEDELELALSRLDDVLAALRTATT